MSGVPAGAGKGWAKGKTAATDIRVANAAAAHRGLKYERRTPPELCGWSAPPGTMVRQLPLGWSPPMAYVVGLMATDGCLITGRHQLNFKSEDEQLVQTFLNCLGRATGYRAASTRHGNVVYIAQFSDSALYRWLQTIGLMPRKSLVLGRIDVPRELLFHCARGLLDGDGSLVNFWYDGTGKAAGRRYEGFITRFISASRDHIEWLQTELELAAGVHGSVTKPSEKGSCWSLNYAIRESCALLPLIYEDEDVPKLERKWLTWKGFATRHGFAAASRGDSTTHEDPRGRPYRDDHGRFTKIAVKEPPAAYAAAVAA